MTRFLFVMFYPQGESPGVGLLSSSVKACEILPATPQCPSACNGK